MKIIVSRESRMLLPRWAGKIIDRCRAAGKRSDHRAVLSFR